MVWALNALVILHWRNFDAEWVVFEQTSGQTHLLTAVQAAALMCIQDSPSDMEQVIRFLHGLDGQCLDLSEAELQTGVSNLQSLGLIEVLPR
ncbi:HPr-rel-A system PqqD family peptide chaperone [Roseateles toxinivorans]|uniref:PqqD family protein of HPr-rel-A system n=1 Tax=Roseateles toxinivorans TaxID=270368 RepID=A0A4R6QSS2_9BURK|nr:HPr-rel-A system PqqD family peptide chaperone [Roseateles toxinivorans]TDP74594.1 PqqD family protein of HPr-rel-A system [Roseateles toxinivorans]